MCVHLLSCHAVHSAHCHQELQSLQERVGVLSEERNVAMQQCAEVEKKAEASGADLARLQLVLEQFQSGMYNMSQYTCVGRQAYTGIQRSLVCDLCHTGESDDSHACETHTSLVRSHRVSLGLPILTSITYPAVSPCYVVLGKCCVAGKPIR